MKSNLPMRGFRDGGIPIISTAVDSRQQSLCMLFLKEPKTIPCLILYMPYHLEKHIFSRPHFSLPIWAPYLFFKSSKHLPLIRFLHVINYITLITEWLFHTVLLRNILLFIHCKVNFGRGWYHGACYINILPLTIFHCNYTYSLYSTEISPRLRTLFCIPVT
jgi:hypothetical protein